MCMTHTLIIYRVPPLHTYKTMCQTYVISIGGRGGMSPYVIALLKTVIISILN